MKSISILGCGWLGFPVAQHLQKSGWEVKGSSRNESRLQELDKANIKPFNIDLENLENLDSSFFNSDVLLLNVPPKNGQISHLEMLNELKEHVSKGKIKWVLYVSSTGIYPNLKREVTESDASSSATSRGGVILKAAEEVWSKENSFTHTVIRFAGLYGPKREPARFFKGKENIPGGLNPVNMIHLDDCIGAIEAILVKELQNEVFNICSPDHPTRIDFYSSEAKKAQLEPPGFQQDQTEWKIVDPSKFISQSGYTFKH